MTNKQKEKESRNRLFWFLRKQGMTYQEIGEMFGLHWSTVSYACEHQANRERANNKKL